MAAGNAKEAEDYAPSRPANLSVMVLSQVMVDQLLQAFKGCRQRAKPGSFNSSPGNSTSLSRRDRKPSVLGNMGLRVLSRRVAPVAICALTLAVHARAETMETRSLDEVNKELSNPISSIWAFQHTYCLNKRAGYVVNLPTCSRQNGISGSRLQCQSSRSRSKEIC
jgi:hypothetical protein